MNKEIRLGVIGMSEGNGHPYSWSAICNGYNPEVMAACPFQSIPQYLSEQKWPNARIPNVRVSHIWTQSKEISFDIARSANIENVVEQYEQMIGEIDGLLLARDDAQNHLEMSRPFLEAGIPIFIDKPFALSLSDAQQMLQMQKYEAQLFTTSSLRYAADLRLTDEEKGSLEKVLWVEASVPKYWDTYAVHVLEPIVAECTQRGEFDRIIKRNVDQASLSMIYWENLTAFVKLTGNLGGPISLKYFGTADVVNKIFKDSFTCFKKSIEIFLKGIHERKLMIDRTETLEIVKIIEAGRS